jgi:hypothetical protein
MPRLAPPVVLCRPVLEHAVRESGLPWLAAAVMLVLAARLSGCSPEVRATDRQLHHETGLCWRDLSRALDCLQCKGWLTSTDGGFALSVPGAVSPR